MPCDDADDAREGFGQHQRAVATRIRLTLQKHGMRIADAFAMMDANRDGLLSPEELYDGGLDSRHQPLDTTHLTLDPRP